jgi:hypothetical protein
MVAVDLEEWTTVAGGTFSSATAAHQSARYNDSVALAAVDAAAPVSLAGVV